MDCVKQVACVLGDGHEVPCHNGPRVLVDYTNWAGKRRTRFIVPTEKLAFMASPPWHPDKQWLFGAIDVEDGHHKFFAMDGIHGWEEDK